MQASCLDKPEFCGGKFKKKKKSVVFGALLLFFSIKTKWYLIKTIYNQNWLAAFVEKESHEAEH